MTQVKDKTDQQLNRALAELMGYTIKSLPIGENGRKLYALVTPSGRERLSTYTIDSAYLDAPDYCNDPSASLEVQAKALEVNHKGYILQLGERTRRGRSDLDEMFKDMLNASPRERAEAAYITLSSKH